MCVVCVSSSEEICFIFLMIRYFTLSRQCYRSVVTRKSNNVVFILISDTINSTRHEYFMFDHEQYVKQQLKGDWH